RGRESGITIDDVRKDILVRDDLVVADRSDAVLARVTTTQAIEEESALLRAVERGRSRARTLAVSSQIRGLGEDQVRVARHVLGSSDRVLAVEGMAGTGKTRVLAYVRERAEEGGWRVRGFAPTGTAAELLRESGIASVTVAAGLREPLASGRQPQLWIVDEAGLLSSHQARELLDRAEKAEAKVVLVGDRQQHRAVEAGSPFALLIDRGGLATERLDVIRRQTDERLRETVLAASEAGGAHRAVQLLEKAGRVVEIPDARLRHEAIARDFIADGGRGVVIAPTNAERDDLNRRIREALIEAGRVERRSMKSLVMVRRDLTREQKGRASTYAVGDVLRFVRAGNGIEAGERARVISIDERRNLLRLQLEASHLPRVVNPRERRAFELIRLERRRFAVGDRVQFRERDRALDVANGTLGTIRKLDPERGVATIEVAGRSVRLDLAEPRALDHAYALTSHRSQGLSRERAYLTVDTSHSEELVNRRQFYVSVSRAVKDARVYTDDRLALSRVLSREQVREGALELLDRAPVKTRIERLRSETALDLVGSSHEGGERERGAGRTPGSDRRGPDLHRGADTPGRGAEGAGRAPGRASGPERGRAQGADRVPGQDGAGPAGASRGESRGPGRGGRQDRGADDSGRDASRGSAGRDGRTSPERDAEARPAANDPRASGDAGRRLPGRPGGQLALWRDDEPAVGRNRGRDERREDRTVGAEAKREEDQQAPRHAGALTRVDIERSADLQRRYAAEYAAMLRVIGDRDVAREAALLNLRALLSDQQRIVPLDVRLPPDRLADAVARGKDDLAAIRRGVSSLVEREQPARLERLPLRPHLERER
ncbi:MAG TPA: AAA family ATPase, partial [Vicinamibacteria bacterium]|nr:AAA family ATPase [Vicinamibacteria bacterium]